MLLETLIKYATKKQLVLSSICEKIRVFTKLGFEGEH